MFRLKAETTGNAESSLLGACAPNFEAELLIAAAVSTGGQGDQENAFLNFTSPDLLFLL
jgi:hypothetical protein